MFSMARKLREEEQGFTLIELLIVIVILGVLASVAVFAVGPFKDSASAACTKANSHIADTGTQATAAGITSPYADKRSPSDAKSDCPAPTP